MAYIGDDINDLSVLKLAGLSASPADAPVYVRKRVAMVTAVKGGSGVLREVADLVLASRGYLEKVLKGL